VVTFNFGYGYIDAPPASTIFPVSPEVTMYFTDDDYTADLTGAWTEFDTDSWLITITDGPGYLEFYWYSYTPEQYIVSGDLGYFGIGTSDQNVEMTFP